MSSIQDKLKALYSKYRIHLIALVIINLVTSAYFISEIKDDKSLAQSDIIQYKGAASEVFDYRDNKDDAILWTNSQFSGMPTYQISGVNGENPMKALRIPKNPPAWSKIALAMICAYIMFIAFRLNPWLALIGSFAVAFPSNNMILIATGHNTQALAIAYIPLIIAGVQYLFRNRYLLGFNLIAVGMALQLLVNHVQITYYTGIIVLLFMLLKFILAIRDKKIMEFVKVSGIALVAVALAVGANSLNLMLSNEYAKETIRGKSELTISPETQKLKDEKPSDGLARWYAFQWSNGWQDLCATIIPNYAGGGSSTDIGEGSVFEGKLAPQYIKNFPFSYWGQLPTTEGPIYLGASLVFLFILGLLILKGPIRWWLLAAVIVSLVLSMGKNGFVWINDFFFYNVPLYNKFRAPTMALVIAQVAVPILALLGLNAYFKTKDKDEEAEKSIKWAGIGVGGFLIILTFFSGMLTDFSHKVVDENGVQDYDQQIFQQSKIEPALLVDVRQDLIQQDGLRSLFFVAAIFLILWFHNKGKFKTNYAMIAIGLLVLADHWMVSRRYLSDDDFQSERIVKNQVLATEVDKAIMQDKSYYRVLDLQGNPMSNAKTSYFHKSLGGYNAAKIRRYQELFDWYINKDMRSGAVLQSPYINMLNTKYIIYQDQKSGEARYMVNPGALGNAWFANSYEIVPNADSAILAIDGFDPTQLAVVEQVHAGQLSGLNVVPDSNASVRLTSYHPEVLEYEYETSNEGILIFSEVFYDKGWNAYIDNNKVDYFRADFVLRGLRVPAGKHNVTFKFEPETYEKGKTIMNISSGLIYLFLLGSLGLGIRNELSEKSDK